jgi:hypothetical protein
MVTVTDKTEEELWQEQIEKIALLITNSLVQVIIDDDIEILFLNTPPF